MRNDPSSKDYFLENRQISTIGTSGFMVIYKILIDDLIVDFPTVLKFDYN